MTFEQTMQWMQEHQEKNAYEDLTDAIRQALWDNEDEDLGRYVIYTFQKAKEGTISPEQAAQWMFSAFVGRTLSSLVRRMAENKEYL